VLLKEAECLQKMYLERRRLTHEDVRRLVKGSVELIREAQLELNIPLGPHIIETGERLSEGDCLADSLEVIRGCQYGMDFGCFAPPSTIILDRDLAFSDKPMDIPELASTLSLYTAVHEVLHADDWVGGDKLQRLTRDHMLREHKDKLVKAFDFIKDKDGTDCIKTVNELANLNATHYVDMVTHFKSFVVLRYTKAPKLEMIWDKLSINFFPPNLLTMIETEKGTEYVFSLFTEKAGSYCLIDAFEEYESIGKRSAQTYTV
jgi:hypothetical protein